MTNELKLILTTSDGELLDSVSVSWEDWEVAQKSDIVALSIIQDLYAGEKR